MKYVKSIEMCVGEFEINMPLLFPYGKCKIKIYEKQSGEYYGYSDIKIKSEGGDYSIIKSYGKTKDEVLNNLINVFVELNEKYPEGLEEHEIEYIEYPDF